MGQITLTFPDGAEKQAEAGTTPAQIAEGISKSLAKKAISAQVNGQQWDLQWPIESDAQIAINTMKDEGPALELIRHDLAHIMARAVQEIWPDVKVTIGPVIENGWYYDFDRAEPFTPEDLGLIEERMRKINLERNESRKSIDKLPAASLSLDKQTFLTDPNTMLAKLDKNVAIDAET